MPRHSRLLSALLWLGASSLAAAPSLEVRPTATPPKIDGVLDDAAWRDAAHSDDFRQIEPRENVPATERTEFWVTYDTDNLYVAVRCHDSGGRAGVRAYTMQRDRDTGSDDLVRVVLDTFHRQNDGYYFALTAAGGRLDGLVQNKEEGNDQWDAIWLGRTTIDDGGWSAEFAIPVKSLSFDPAGSSWGFEIGRAVRRKQEVIRWSGRIRNKPTIALSQIGEIRGLAGFRQGRGLDFKPFASLTRHSDPAPGERRLEYKPGFDLVWHVTPSLAATLTVNTDFADADVDERQVNLGRFSLFFPEKRSFFTQDAPLFTFAGIGEDPLPFFSRRIGLADDGTKVDLLGGAKLTGRAGPWTIGLLDVQTDRHGSLDSKNLFVGRITHQVFAESSAGLILTNGDPRVNGGNRLLGADFNYVNSRLAGGKSLSVRAAIQYTDSDFTGGRGAAGTLSVNFPNEPYAFFVWFSRLGNEFDPALGFAPRAGVSDLHFWNRYRWYPMRLGVRNLDLGAEVDIVSDLRGRRLDRTFWLPIIEGVTIGGDFFNIQRQDRTERLDAPFAIRPGIIIPAGDHYWSLTQFYYESSRVRPVNVRLVWRTGGLYTGDRQDYELGFGWRPSTHTEFSLSHTLRELRLPQGRFDVRLASAKATYTFSPDLQLSLLAQFDNFSDTLGVNFRLKWTPTPGNEIFVVVNQGYDASGDQLRPLQNDTSLKTALTFRF